MKYNLCFQHGLGANRNQSFDLLNDLEDTRLVAFDCPGHGAEPLANHIPSFDNYADFVIEGLRAQGIERSVFGGISMGSGISVNIALRYPQFVEGLILVRPAWLAAGRPDNLAILIEAAKWIGKEGGVEHFASLPEFIRIKGDLETVGQSILGVFDRGQQPAIPEVLKAMVQDHPFPTMDALASIDVPTMVIGNLDDPLHPYDMAETIYQQMNGSTIHQVPSRYVDPKNHKQSITKLVTEFLNQL